MTAHQLTDDELAAAIAECAGHLLVEIRACSMLEGKVLGAAGDAISHELVTRLLREARPADGLLSEEAAGDPARIAQRRVWIVDPLDGTREYSESSDGEGRSDWAVHVALVTEEVPVAAAVALPAMGVTYSTSEPVPRKLPGEGPIRILVSRSRPPSVARLVCESLGAELVPMGSAGAKTIAVVRGEAHAYLHAGGQYEWDSAAPTGVAVAAGLHVSRIDGSPLRYNQPDPLLPDLLVCHPEVAADLLAAIADAADG